jgi:phosphatidylinositol alpha-mannosyltransferase
VAPVRIGIVCPYSLTIPGGVQSQVLGLAKALRRLGHRVRVLGPCDGVPPEAGITPLGFSIPTAANGSVAPLAPDVACALRTIRALWDEEFDVIHLHEPLAPGPTQTALLLKTQPMIGTFHAAGDMLMYRFPGLKWLASRMRTRAAVSQDAAQFAARHIGGEYEVLFNGIDLERFTEVEPAPVSGPTALFVGRHEPRKGLDVLVDAFGGLPADHHLWVVGTGPETERLKEQTARDHRIEWLGTVGDDDLAARMKGASVLCAPSLANESFGVVLLEAMAAGTPVVASDLAGYRNVVDRGDEAVLVPPGDSGALNRAMRSVMGSSGHNGHLVEAGRARACQFSMQRLAGLYVDLYHQTLRSL